MVHQFKIWAAGLAMAGNQIAIAAFQPTALVSSLASGRNPLLNVVSPSPPGANTEELSSQVGNSPNGSSNDTFSLHHEVDVDITHRTKQHYNYKEFLPRGGLLQRLRWLITGESSFSSTQSDETRQQSLSSLARMLILLREYKRRFGIPAVGGHAMQQQVMSDIVLDLYSSGAPTWVLDTVMERVAEGMTGKQGVQLLILPNRCFIYYPESKSPDTNTSQCAGTSMFRINAGFDIYKLGAVEQVAVRLASFASNTQSVERLDARALRIPKRNELDSIKLQETTATSQYLRDESVTEEQLAESILNLASSTYGLFYFLNNPRFQVAINSTAEDDNFWEVTDSTRELFTRLAASEASQAMETIRNNKRQLFSPRAISLFRILSSAGACSLWFGGGFEDMLVSGALAVIVACITTSRKLAFEERVLTDVVASFFVGLCAGLLAIQWPSRFCFGAIAVASVMDFMQGFKIVYAVIEVMSRNKVTGTARLLEGILFTGLISYSLIFGLDVACRIMLSTALPLDYSSMLNSARGISPKLFPLILPFTATAWSALFRPGYGDIPLMAFHGMLAMCLSWAGTPLFAAAACVTFSSGIISRFTGRQALGNTLAGLYALVPGAYMVRALLSLNKAGFIENVLTKAITIGLGGWTGTILCSPTILGKSSRALGRQPQTRKQEAMLYF